ncbi:zinc-dependent peptidase [Kiritimatiellota bacterium B12222]|nr:zinc-dependent peptidase [Kiritimatiellota bacterium B12222]
MFIELTQRLGWVGSVSFLMIVGVAGAWGWQVYMRQKKRKALLSSPFPEGWEQLLKERWPVYETLPDEVKKRLGGYTRIFVAEKNFEGCGGLEMTEEIKVVIAAQACLLLAGRELKKVYPALKSVLVYPHTFVAGGKGIFGGKYDEPSARLGESWQTGTVILSWHSVEGGARNIEDGHNVTLHEFAHQLDQADGVADGAPDLHGSAAKTWAHCFQQEFKDFLDQLDHGKRTVIDDYGATNGAEFFATATEAFFEKSAQLADKRPELYVALKDYYGLDPEQW